MRGAQLFDGVVRNHLALVQDHDMRGDTLNSLQFVRAEQNDFAAPGKFPDQISQDESGIDVEPGKRFVQQDDFRIMQQRRGEKNF